MLLASISETRLMVWPRNNKEDVWFVSRKSPRNVYDKETDLTGSGSVWIWMWTWGTVVTVESTFMDIWNEEMKEVPRRFGRVSPEGTNTTNFVLVGTRVLRDRGIRQNKANYFVEFWSLLYMYKQKTEEVDLILKGPIPQIY